MYPNQIVMFPSADHNDLPLSVEYSGQVGLRASNMHYLWPYVL